VTRATVRLTKRAIDQAKPLLKPYFVWDGELKGFGARIDPGGAKTFAVRYRPKGHGASAPKRFITIGRYGALTVDEARNRAKEILGAVATGADPAADLALRRSASTFKEIADLFLREHVGPKRKMSTAQDYESLLTTYAIPALGNRKAEAVTRAEVSSCTVRSAIDRTKPIDYLPLSAAYTLSRSGAVWFRRVATRPRRSRSFPRSVESAF